MVLKDEIFEVQAVKYKWESALQSHYLKIIFNFIFCNTRLYK